MRHLLLISTVLSLCCANLATAGAPPIPSCFVPRVTNPWFPLRPGSVLVYRGEQDGKKARDVFRVTSRHKRILGVSTTVIQDRGFVEGRPSERTVDWYAQDCRGNVWYFGERTATLDRHGHVQGREGSWKAGVNGAQAGIYMPASPTRGEQGWQEWYPGHAQDRYRVLSVRGGALLTEETSPLEPGVVDHKLYVRGVGDVREESIKGGNERLVLHKENHG